MAERLELPDQDLQALATGRTIVAFGERHAVGLNDELELIATGPRPAAEVSDETLAAGGAPPDGLVGLVVGLQPAASLSDAAGDHHILTATPDGDLIILRVFADSGPVLGDAEFEQRRAAVEAMFR